MVGKSTELAPDKENIHVRVDLAFEVEEEDGDPADVVEWAAFGFIFVLAVLSFADARPRGLSEVDYSAKDDLTVADFLRACPSENGDYIFAQTTSGKIHEDRHNRSIRRNRNAHHLGTWRGCPTLAGPAQGKETDGAGLNWTELSATQEISFEKQHVRLLLQTPRQNKIQYNNAVSASLESLNRNH